MNRKESHKLATPSLICPGEWTVETTDARMACVEQYKNILRLPTPRVREDILVHLHELGHIAVGIKIRKIPGSLVPSFDKLLLEVAVESYSYGIGADIRQARDHLDWQEWTLPTERIRLALEYLQFWYSADGARNPAIPAIFRAVSQSLSGADASILNQAATAVARTPKDSAVLYGWADKLANHFFEPPPEPPKPRESKQSRQARKQAEWEESQEQAEQAEREADQQRKANQADTGAVGKIASGLTVHNHAGRSGNAKIAAGKRASWAGARMGYPYRLFTDGKVLEQRAKGGSILLDGSGSMSWNYDALAVAVKDLPTLWAGVYRGTRNCWSRSGHSTELGILCVVASKGKVSDIPRDCNYDAGNCGTDLPAIRTMTRLGTPPYVVVTDRAFWHHESGHNVLDDMTTQIGQELYELSRAKGIVYVATIKDAIDYLQGKQVAGYRRPYLNLKANRNEEPQSLRR